MRGISVKSAIFLTAIVTLSTGCETVRTSPQRGAASVQTKEVMPVPSSRSTQGTGSVLFVAEFKGLENQNEECRWRVVNNESGKSFFMTIKAGNPNVYTQLDPGSYKTTRFGCGISRVWDIDDVFKDGFRVEDGKVSYIGKLTFVFNKKGTLDLIHKATRIESAQAFTSALEATPAANIPAISGFTGKPIEAKMVELGEARDGFDVFAKGVDDPAKALEPLVKHLQSCAKTEGTMDPLRFGRLEYTAVYRDGRFIEMKDRIEKNAFSDRLRSCVERGIMAFHPAKKTDVEVRVRY